MNKIQDKYNDSSDSQQIRLEITKIKQALVKNQDSGFK